MFDGKVVKSIAEKHRKVLNDLYEIQKELNNRFVDMDDAILALLLSTAGREPLLLIGPPGTAKSRMIRSFCSTVGLTNEDHPDMKGPNFDKIVEQGEKDAVGYFEYLLTPFTEPNELFGYYDIGKLMSPNQGERKLERNEKGMMHRAYVVYLDEVFNASSAILNSLLAFLQEHIFHDRGEPKPAYTRALFAATNRIPDSVELKAVYDRFLLRCNVKNVDLSIDRADHLPSLLTKGWYETYGRNLENGADLNPANKTPLNGSARYNDLFKNLKILRQSIQMETTNRRLVPNPELGNGIFYKNLRETISESRSKSLSDMSNRRVLKMVNILLIYSMYRGINQIDGEGKYFELGPDELRLIDKFFLDRQRETERFQTHR
jgi:MoxR-like ATPase